MINYEQELVSFNYISNQTYIKLVGFPLRDRPAFYQYYEYRASETPFSPYITSMSLLLSIIVLIVVVALVVIIIIVVVVVVVNYCFS